MIHSGKKILWAGLSGIASGLLALSATAAPRVAMPATLPLYFEASRGQANVPAQFIARGRDYQFLISPDEARIVLRQNGAEPAEVRMEFAGANPQALIHGDAELPGKINYFTGSDPAHWRTGVPMFAQVRIGGLYPGIDLVYYGNQQLLEYDITVAPGAEPEAIAMRFDGADKISISPQGELILSLAGGEIHQPKPVIYQMLEGVRKEINGGYRLMNAHTVGFVIGRYDRSQPLVIDPILSYSTFIGGNAGETAYSVALDTNGSVYITGQTFSSQYSKSAAFATAGAFQTNYAGGKLTGDAFIFKLDAVSGSPAYITYLGGSADDGAFGIAVDSGGNAYVTGFTDSTNFPTTTNALYRTISGVLDKKFGFYPVDAFVAELDSGGSNLVYSTYLGGSSMDSGMGIAVDTTGSAYVTGFTYSSNFPTVNALQKNLACTNSFYFNANAFIAKIGPGGSPLVYSTYFGGTNFDEGKGIAVDTNGFVYVTGFTASTNFPTTNYVYQLIGNEMVDGHILNGVTNKNKYNLSYDAFVSKFDPTGTNLVYSTFLGRTNNDVGNGIAVDNTGAAYVTGWSVCSNFPNTFGTNIAGLRSFVATNTRPSIFATNAFLTKITNGPGTPAGIAWSGLFGGRGVDVGNSVAVDPAGEVFVAGSATSTNFPSFNVPGLMRTTNSGKSDAFVIAFNTNATALLYSTYLGGKENDYGYGIAVYTNGDAYVVGQTLSSNFPTLNAIYPTRNGTNDAFLTKIMMTVQPPVITTQPADQTVAVGATVSFSVYGTGTAPFFFQWQKDTTNLVNGGNISGATNNVLTIVNAQITNSGTYLIIVTNYGGSATSSNAVLTVTNVPPGITVQPTNQLVGVGTTVTLVVSATGTGPLSYQWQVDGTNLVDGNTTHAPSHGPSHGSQNGAIIRGATANVLTIRNVQTTNSGNYTVIITNPAGSITSSNALVTVITAPEITLQPTNQSMAAGTTATLAVTAVGLLPLSYQWQMNGTNVVNGGGISGATADVLSINNAQTTNSGSYTVSVANSAGSVTSSNAVLTVTNVSPAIAVQPTDQMAGVGTTVTLTVTATGTAPLSYQWLVNGTNVINGTSSGATNNGATTNVLTISNVQTNNSGIYSVIVTNIAGFVASSNAVLTVISAPVITLQPTNQFMASGSTATFAIAAVGMVPLKYHWQLNGTNLLNGGQISGATTNVLVISNAQTNNNGSYAVVVTNLAGSVTSSNAVLTVTNIPPAITLQPTNQAVAMGTTVTLTVNATGSAPLSYQWQLDGTNLLNGGFGNPHNGSVISGATANVLTIKNPQTNNSGSYTVIVTNVAGLVTSSNAVLTVASSPVILTQPTNQSLAVGSTATLAVSAVGILPLSYQWQVDGMNLTNGGGITGVATNVLRIFNAQTTNSGNYTVTIMNSSGSVTSSNAVLSVTNIPPAITVQPTNQTVAVGSTATLAVTATGTAPLSYQWQDGTNFVDGATNNILMITNAQTTDSGSYSVIVNNPGGSVTSSNAILIVAEPPVITLQPTNQTVAAGSTVTLAVTATGADPLSYQWQADGTNLMDGDQFNGAISNVLTISNVQVTNSASYAVIVMNPGGSVTSSNAVLTVTNIPPTITLQPTNQTVAAGSTVTLAVAAIGTDPLTYQWQVDGTNLMDGGQFIGAISNLLTISNVQTTNNGTYTVTVTNLAGMATSSNAVLTVTASALPPSFGKIMAAEGGGFILSGTGGASNGTYYVLASSDLLAPLTNWTSIATDQFDSVGNFIFTNTTQTNATQLFYILQLP